MEPVKINPDIQRSSHSRSIVFTKKNTMPVLGNKRQETNKKHKKYAVFV